MHLVTKVSHQSTVNHIIVSGTTITWFRVTLSSPLLAYNFSLLLSSFDGITVWSATTYGGITNQEPIGLWRMFQSTTKHRSETPRLIPPAYRPSVETFEFKNVVWAILQTFAKGLLTHQSNWMNMYRWHLNNGYFVTVCFYLWSARILGSHESFTSILQREVFPSATAKYLLIISLLRVKRLAHLWLC